MRLPKSQSTKLTSGFWCTILLKEKIVSNKAFIAADICWYCKIPQQHCPITVTLGLRYKNHHFWHNDWHCDRLGKHRAWRQHNTGIYCHLPRSCLCNKDLAVERPSKPLIHHLDPKWLRINQDDQRSCRMTKFQILMTSQVKSSALLYRIL